MSPHEIESKAFSKSIKTINPFFFLFDLDNIFNQPVVFTYTIPVHKTLLIETY